MNNIDQDPLFLWQAALVCSGTGRGGVVEPAAWTKCRVQNDGLPMRWFSNMGDPKKCGSSCSISEAGNEIGGCNSGHTGTFLATSRSACKLHRYTQE